MTNYESTLTKTNDQQKFIYFILTQNTFFFFGTKMLKSILFQIKYCLLFSLQIHAREKKLTF